MGILSKLFSSSDTASDMVNAAINTGDKLFYTDEEKADTKRKMIEFFPTLLGAYSPFKLAQRILAMIFTFLFSIAFLTGVGMTAFNIISKYIASSNNQEVPPLLELQPLYDLVSAFSLDYIILAIVSFYFAGGVVDSLKRNSK